MCFCFWSPSEPQRFFYGQLRERTKWASKSPLQWTFFRPKCTAFVCFLDQWTTCLEKLYVLFFRYLFCSNFLTVYRNEPYNIPLESYGLDATSPCWTLFEIPRGLKAVLKMVRPMTSGSKHFFTFFSKPLVGMKQMVRCWIDIIEVYLLHI